MNGDFRVELLGVGDWPSDDAVVDVRDVYAYDISDSGHVLICVASGERLHFVWPEDSR